MGPTERASAFCLLWVGLGCAVPPFPVAPREGRSAPVAISDGRYAMGSILEITLVGVAETEANRALEKAYSEVARLEKLASRHDTESALSRLNRGEGLDALPPDLLALLRESVRYAEMTRGAFDISVGTWVDLWIAAAERDRLPSVVEREAARARSGPHAFSIDERGRAVLAEGARLDLGAIAKGFALDRLVADVAPGARGALFNFGQSSYWGLGRPADSDAWRLLLRDPDGGYAGTLELHDRALSISASLGRSSAIEGRRYGHIIDPRSGEALYRNAQVAVLAPHASLAEALSTAVLVMGADEGLAAIEGLPDCEALWLETGATRMTSGWQRASRFQAGVK